MEEEHRLRRMTPGGGSLCGNDITQEGKAQSTFQKHNIPKTHMIGISVDVDLFSGIDVWEDVVRVS